MTALAIIGLICLLVVLYRLVSNGRRYAEQNKRIIEREYQRPKK